MDDLDAFLISEEKARRYLHKPLVSSLYRLAPPPAGVTVSKDQGEVRLRMTMRRLVRQYGVANVVTRIRKADGPVYVKSWLVLTAEAENVRARGLP